MGLLLLMAIIFVMMNKKASNQPETRAPVMEITEYKTNLVIVDVKVPKVEETITPPLSTNSGKVQLHVSRFSFGGQRNSSSEPKP